MRQSIGFLLLCTAVATACRTTGSEESEASAVNWPRVKEFAPPPKVSWRPTDIRSSHVWPELMPLPEAFRTFHSDQRNSDQVTNVHAPMFKQGWVAETNLYIPEGPSFDNEGHIYVVPVRPPIDVQLVSIDRQTGARRFAIPGKRAGQGGAPLILKDPKNPEKNIIYYGSYEYLTAVTSDGKIVWDVPTGLKIPENYAQIDIHNFGVNYLSRYDALVSSMGDGALVVHDRATGRRLLKDIFFLPGAKSSAKGSSAMTKLPEAVLDRINAQLAPLFEAPPAGEKSKAVENMVAAVVGGGAKVANYFGIDPTSGRLWVASTAADDADGKADGSSEYGAIYGLDFVRDSRGDRLVVHCSKSFAGGSASSPSLRADGKRIYFGDAFNKVLAIDDNCQEIWGVDVGEQILGSLAISDNNGEIYASGAKQIFKIVEEGNKARLVWKSSTDIFNTPLGVLKPANLNLAGISSNGIVVHVGAGVEFRGHVLPTQVGLVLLDRDTGKVLYAARGREESIAAMTSSTDGGVYLAHSPIRRAVAHAITGKLTEPVIGGVGQYQPIRLDLLARDASCAALYRAENLIKWLPSMPQTAITMDFAQIGTLIRQARKAAKQAQSDGDLDDERAQLFLTTLDYPYTMINTEQLKNELLPKFRLACDMFD